MKSGVLGVLWCAALLAPAAAHARDHAVSTHVSPDGHVTAVVTAPARSGRYYSGEPARASVTIRGRAAAEYELFEGFPNQVIVLDDGRLVTLGRGCCPEDRVERLIAVFDSRGDVAFDVGLHQLVRLASPAVRLSSGSYHGPEWFREARLVDGATVEVVLEDYNELRLSLGDLALSYVVVANEELEHPDRLRERGITWLEGGRRDEGIAILQSLSQGVPADHEAATRLARHQSSSGDHRAAIATLSRLIEDYPLLVDTGWGLCNTPASPFGMRCDLVRAYLRAGESAKAMRLIHGIRPYSGPDIDLDLLAIDALLGLDRAGEADTLAGELLAREQDSPFVDWLVRRVQDLYLRHGLGRRAAELLDARAGGNDPDVLEARARGLIRAGDETAAVPVLQALMHAGRQAVAATLLGDIHADQKGGVPLDPATARRWYKTATQALDAGSWDARFELERARWQLCQLSLISRDSSGRAEAVRWCDAAADDQTVYRQDAVFWAGILRLDAAFDGAGNREPGLRLLASAPCPPLGWFWPPFDVATEYAKDLYHWAVSTLERHVDRGGVRIEVCLGNLLARGESPNAPPYKPERARELLTAAAAQGDAEASLTLAQFLERHYCSDGACDAQVRALYRRAAELGESWGHFYLAKRIVEGGADAELRAAIGHLDTFSKRQAEEQREYACRREPRESAGRHTAEALYLALEARLGQPVERTPDRGCL